MPGTLQSVRTLAGERWETPLRGICLPPVDQPFNNRGLFSDHYLQTIVPAHPDWTDSDFESDREALRQVWEQASALVDGHEGQTEEHWIRPVLEQLGFAFQVQTPVADGSGGIRWPDYALFGDAEARSNAQRSAGSTEYFEGALAVADAKVWDARLDRKPEYGANAGRNPNYQIDLYLRRTDQLWGILTNGRLWRLYCRDTSYRLDSYYEVDLVDLLDRDDGSFKYFWLFFRAAAFRDQPDSFLDLVRAGSREYAEGLSERVKGRIYEALSNFINGFFAYPGNRLDPDSDLEDAYSGSLILLYRILFALYAEAHGLLPLDNASYRDTYSLYRIKAELAERLDRGGGLLASADNYFSDLKTLFRVIDEGADEIGVPAYNGGLFALDGNRFLAENEIGDESLAAGLDLLARVPSTGGGQVFVDFKTLEVRHLGDIYEGLLEYHARYADVAMVAVREGRRAVWREASAVESRTAVVDEVPAGTCYLTTGNGERRATGSYYTPQDIVEQMVADSVGGAVAELEAEFEGDDLVEGLLGVRVCDPAMGSGHFLVEVVDYLARAIVRVGGASLEAEDDELLTARRAVVERCVYGVDPNPLAVELAKLSLWLETVARDRPLSFIDTHLLCGNSLIGTDIAAMASLGGARDQQMNLVEEALESVRPSLIERAQEIPELDPDTIQGVREKQHLFDEMNRLREAFVRTADLWTSQHFGIALAEDEYLLAVSNLSSEDEQATETKLGRDVVEVARRFRFHHWPLAFPDVFLNDDRPAGFDVVLTNPPYVSAIARRDAYTDLEDRFWRSRFDSGAKAFDLYVLFIELALRLARPGGWVDLITPNKVLSAPYAKALREYVVGNHALTKLIDASGVEVFEDPNVYPVISLFRAGPESPLFVEVWRLNDERHPEHIASHPSDSLARLPESIWAFLVLKDADLLLRIADDHAQLEGHLGLQAIASTAASEAAEYADEINEEKLATSPGWRLVVTGTIGPFAGRWGLEPLRSHQRRYLRPVLPFKSNAVSATRRDQYWAPKLIFKKICLRLEATLDREGDYASRDTNFVFPGKVDLFALGALMHSSLLTWIFEGYFGALRMNGGYMQAQAPQLRVLPIPALPVELDHDVLARAVEGDSPPDLDDLEPNTRDYIALARLGHEWFDVAEGRCECKVAVVGDLHTALGLAGRREEEPAFVLPRQAAILDALADAEADDLSAFWRALGSTARDLGVKLTPKREAAVLQIVQRGREEVIKRNSRIEEIQAEVDETVFSLYGLMEPDRQRVRAGHVMPAGLEDA